jgi:hypothetical protein
MDPSYIIGVSGATLLIVAWITSLVRTLRARKHTIDPLFTAIYFCASLALTVYSALIHDSIFAVLNGIATLIALIEYIAYWRFRV